MTAPHQAHEFDWAGWENLTPLLRYANFFDAPPGGGFGPRYLEDFQILVMQAGQGTISIDDVRYELAPGDAVFYGPNERHQVTSSVSDPLRLAGIHFVMCAEDEAKMSPGYAFGRPMPWETPTAIPPLAPSPLPNSRRVAQRGSSFVRGVDSQLCHHSRRTKP
jgi:mannose-6-phosphate isomerase-like protein (cupin superfamily)